jgi:hypothetical protein
VKLFILILLLLVGGGLTQAQERIPRFKDYPVTTSYIGRNAPVKLTGGDRTFRTRLREAAKEKPNFAGHYILTTWGCGTSCLMGAVIDAKTGKVYWLPGSICCYGYDTDDNFEPVIVRLDSRLIVLSGMINEEESTNGTHFYKFENGKFKLVRSVPKPAQQ